ncbi:MAG: type II secretion system F family protein [Candidatus Omnitrophica bacterium]|nr:type II secretion system F family protein [Candidatus Omnitrophota bacterium]
MVYYVGIILIFSSLAFIVYIGLPKFFKKYSNLQEKRMKKAERELHDMFMFKDRQKLLSIFTTVPLLMGAIGFIILSGQMIGFGIGAVLGFIIPSIYIKQIASKRHSDFLSQLIDGIMVLSSSLKAGLSLMQSFEVLSDEMPSPIRDEFSLLIRENRMGVSLQDCLLHLRQRNPSDDLILITTAIIIAQETGGDLTQILEQLVFTLREKRKLNGRVRALTVQARLQGSIMALLPIGFACFTYFVTPENFDLLINDTMGRYMILYAVVSEIIGIFLIKILSKVKV